MFKYLHHLRQRPTHERRLHAMRVAGVLTAVIFVGWVTTLGVTLGTGNPANVAQTNDVQAQQTAAAAQASGFSGNQLIVATSSDY